MMKNSIRVFTFILLTVHCALAQQTISGVITDANHVPLPGTTILIRGTTIHAIADSSGFYQLITGEAFPMTLQFNILGFKEQEIEIHTIPHGPVNAVLALDNKLLPEIMISARRRNETAQEIPIPVSVVSGGLVEDAGAFNVNRIKELIPTVQLYSSNPRNTTLNIRGLGSTFGLTNDGIDPGVGFYVDGVYYARPAVTALDFIDVERIEVLRGPQGTLFGKNTTAGAFNITTRAPAFEPAATFEVSYGNYGFIQAKTSVTGSLSKQFAARVSFSGTQRDGLLKNVATQKRVNDLNNIGFRGQLLFVPIENIELSLNADVSSQRPDGYAQVIAGVAPTLRAEYRQFNQIIADFDYSLPSQDPFDRVIDHDTPWRSGNDHGGIALNANFKFAGGTLTSTTAWRYWKWDPSNDRDFTGLPVLSLSQAPSKHKQWSQEFRYAGDISSRITGVVGVYFLGQNLKTNPFHTEESGAAQWRFSQNSTNPLWETPGLLDGYGIRTTSELQSVSAAVFGQIDWLILDKLHILPGIRYNFDQKDIDYDRVTYGGLDTSDPALVAIKNAVYSSQSFDFKTDESNFSGQLTISYEPGEWINVFATYATSYKPVGVNLGGLPTQSGEVLIDLARIKPESVYHLEVGVKTQPTKNSTLNIALHNTTIEDYQTQVQTAEVGVNRGYLANAEEVRVRGIEIDGNTVLSNHLSLSGSIAYTDGIYVSFSNAPVPLEETGGQAAFKDISGGDLPGISRWAGSVGGELSVEGSLIKLKGKYFVAFDSFYRSTFSSSPSPSQYLNIDGYALLNARIGFKATEGISVFAWSRNLLDKEYFEQLLPAAGNAGHFAGVLGDPRTFGVTLRYVL